MKIRSLVSTLEPYVPGSSVPGGYKLSSNENPLGASPRALEALRQALGPGSPAALNRYPDGSVQRLRDAIARFWNIDSNQVLVGNGSDELLVMIGGAFIEPGTNAVTGRHTFSQYTFATTIFGGEMRYSPMPYGSFDLVDIGGRVDADTRVVWLCNPNNPTSTVFTHGELSAFLADIPPEVVVVVDEAYAEFAQLTAFPDCGVLMENHKNLIRLRTFSKIYGLAGLRVGYATAAAELVDLVGRLRQPFNVDTLAQIAAEAALTDTGFVEKSLQNNAAGITELCSCLDELGIRYYPPEANFVCAEFGEAASHINEGLREEGISVRALSSFGLPHHLRLSIGTPVEIAALNTALRKLVGPRP